MNRFAYERASSAEDALRKGMQPDAAYIGGGTNLLDLLKLGVSQPKLLVDLNDAGMDGIDSTADGSLRLGALATMARVARHPAVRQHFPLLRRALLAGATPQLRNAATMGGNLLQRPRCFYFREPGFRCNKRKPGTGCDALTGGNEMHAIFGGGELCIAVHPSDLATALICLDAYVELRQGERQRRMALGDFFVPAQQDVSRETVIEHGELITTIEIPYGPRLSASAYCKVPPAGGFAVVSAAVSLEIENGFVSSARVVMGGVSHTPWRAYWAESRVLKRSAVEATWREAAAAEMAKAQGQGENDYKIALGREVLYNAFTEAAASVSR